MNWMNAIFGYFLLALALAALCGVIFCKATHQLLTVFACGALGTVLLCEYYETKRAEK